MQTDTQRQEQATSNSASQIYIGDEYIINALNTNFEGMPLNNPARLETDLHIPFYHDGRASGEVRCGLGMNTSLIEPSSGTRPAEEYAQTSGKTDNGVTTTNQQRTGKKKPKKSFSYECPLCYEAKENISSLPCGHVFCTTEVLFRYSSLDKR